MNYTVKQARLMSLMSQKEIAEKIGISAKAYWYKEKKPEAFSIGEALRFSKAVGIKFDKIIFVPEETANVVETTTNNCKETEP